MSVSGEPEWRWADPSGQQRLVHTDELRAALSSGVIAPNTPVWRHGWKEWKPAEEVPELSTSALASANGVVQNIPPPPLFIVAVQHEYEDKSVPPGRPNTSDEPPPPPSYVPTATRKALPQVRTMPLPIASPSASFKAAPKKAPASQSPIKSASPAAPYVAAQPSNHPVTSQGLGAKAAQSVPPAPPDDASWDSPPDDAAKVPPPAPSETLIGTSRHAHGGEANTAVDITALTPADAERLLAMRAPPASLETMHGVAALPPPPPLKPSSHASPSPASSGHMRTPPMPMGPPTKAVNTQPGPASPSPASPSPSRSSRPPPVPRKSNKETLVLFGGLPDRAPPPSGATPGINVPSTGTQSPNAVTQPPPWNEGSAQVDPHIPASSRVPMPPMRARAESIEEISASGLETTDSSADVTAQRQPIDGRSATQPGQHVDELSGSVLLPDNSGGVPVWNAPGRMVGAPPPQQGVRGTLLGMPIAPNAALVNAALSPPPSIQIEHDAPTQPRGHASQPDDSGPVSSMQTLLVRVKAMRGPVRDAMDRLVHDVRVLLARPKQRWFLPVVALMSFVVVLGLLGLIIGLARKGSSEEDEAAANASASASAASPGTGGLAGATTKGSGSGTSVAACGFSGGPHVVAPKAIVPSGVEAAAGAGRLALGFAVGPKDGMTVLLDPSSLAATATDKKHSHETIRRVVPQLAGKGLGVVVDADKKGDHLQGARTVLADRTSSGGAAESFVVGAADGQLAWASHASETPRGLWPLDGDGPVEALRGIAVGEGYAIAFRQGTAIYLGALNADKSANGALAKVPGLGPQIGSPSLAASGEEVLVAWADRAGTSEPWGLESLKWKPGEAPGVPRAFALPAGGLGGQAMSPGLAGLGGGRFLLVWTEGPQASHQVRALTLGPAGAPLGDPLTVSAEGVNAGQGQAAVLPDGRGVVVFLASNGTGFEVVATPIACPLSPM